MRKRRKEDIKRKEECGQVGVMPVVRELNQGPIVPKSRGSNKRKVEAAERFFRTMKQQVIYGRTYETLEMKNMPSSSSQ